MLKPQKQPIGAAKARFLDHHSPTRCRPDWTNFRNFLPSSNKGKLPCRRNLPKLSSCCWRLTQNTNNSSQCNAPPAFLAAAVTFLRYFSLFLAISALFSAPWPIYVLSTSFVLLRY